MAATHRNNGPSASSVAFSASESAEPPWRVPGVPFATTVVIADLLPGTRAYTETYRDLVPVLVIDTGPTEIQLSLPADRVALADLEAVDVVLDAMAAYRMALLPHLD